jgi:hypothetical protein
MAPSNPEIILRRLNDNLTLPAAHFDRHKIPRISGTGHYQLFLRESPPGNREPGCQYHQGDQGSKNNLPA